MCLCLEVKDNGKGITEEKLPLIFSEMESDQSANNWDGTGLGLPICAQLTLQLRAFIRYSSINGFTCFGLYIP